jgi:hypothetical protein
LEKEYLFALGRKRMKWEENVKLKLIKRKCFELFKLFAAASVSQLMKGLGISVIKTSDSISREFCYGM